MLAYIPASHVVPIFFRHDCPESGVFGLILMMDTKLNATHDHNCAFRPLRRPQGAKTGSDDDAR